MEISKLNAILEAHLKWLVSGRTEGARANLTYADLTRANLTYANLTYANLTRANLTRANLTRANLTDADLTRADLEPVKKDFFEVLNAAPTEVLGLLEALRAGKINGSQYEGECACLVGTIANIKHCDYTKIEGLAPNASRPAERFFLCIQPGNTPENHQPSKIVEDWILEWMKAGIPAAPTEHQPAVEGVP